MKFYASEALSALALYLFLYVVLVFLLVSFGSAALWYLIWIAGVGGMVWLSLAVADQGQDINRPSTYFAIAAAGVLTLGCLTLSPEAEADIGYYAMLAGTALLGVPLGIGAVRLLLGSWRPLRPRAIIVGALAGALAVAIFLPIIYHLADWGLRSFVALPTVPIVNLFGFDVFPGSQSGTVVRGTLSGEPLGELKLSGTLFFIALLFQGVQSTLAALWDTLVLGVGALAISWAATRLAPGRS
ncbi:MAG TPA: hypothetical protein VIG26_00125 [Methyloceanibacter sp.]